jgi:hypothetical protein
MLLRRAGCVWLLPCVQEEGDRPFVIVMPANSSGWFWHCLARETGRIGHLYSPGAQRGPWPWFPYALDNGAFSCWDQEENTFDEDRWARTEPEWLRLLFWSQAAPIRPRWAIVPDVPGDSAATLDRWARFAPIVQDTPVPLAVAVQDGMTPGKVKALDPIPDVVAVGGSTAWKWASVEEWCREFPRVHLLRCNMPDRLKYLEAIGCESTDGTGWNRGDRKQTRGLEEWAKTSPVKITDPLWPFVCRGRKSDSQLAFA